MSKGKLGMTSGNLIDIFSPHPDQFTFDDIYRGLARESRYGGQVVDDPSKMYSVGQHSVLAADWTMRTIGSATLAMILLFHDASEGLGYKDIPTFLKAELPAYKLFEEKIMRQVWDKINIEPTEDQIEAMHKIDKMMLQAELRQFRGVKNFHPPLEHLFDNFYIWDIGETYEKFGKMHRVLSTRLPTADAA